jgi:hypothetical protein
MKRWPYEFSLSLRPQEFAIAVSGIFMNHGADRLPLGFCYANRI